MKKQILLFISSMLVILTVLESASFVALANDKSDGYVETHCQFDMDNINLSVENKHDLVVTAKKSTNPFTDKKRQSNKKRFEKFLCDYPDIYNQMVDMINNNCYISAFGYTEAEVEYNENEKTFVRVKQEKIPISNPITGFVALAAEKTKKGSPSDKYYFTLVTTITRRGTSNPYTYQTCSTGTWSKNSATGGKKYPASGEDFILQTCPTSMSRQSDSINIVYNHGRTAKSGVDYSRKDGGANYIQYSVADDPAGINQMKSCTLIVNSTGKANSSHNRMINSYYVHTWKSLSISVSASASLNSDKQYGISLTITPTINEKSWNVYSYVTFKF